jgi:hypothetical protein
MEGQANDILIHEWKDFEIILSKLMSFVNKEMLFLVLRCKCHVIILSCSSVVFESASFVAVYE